MKEEKIKELINIIKELGWQLAIPDGNDEAIIKGMIIGEESYVNYILSELP